LLNGAVLHRALLIEQCGEPVDEGDGDLPLDLRRVHRVARIRGRDDAVDLNCTLVDRDLGTGCDIAAVAHVLGEAAVDALRRRLAPARTLGHGIEHREVLGMVGHQLAAELERILPRNGRAHP